MKNKERERQSKYRRAGRGRAKTPLTFYRSADPAIDAQSPFRKKEIAASTGRIGKFFAGFLEWIIFFGLVALLAYSLVIRPSSKVEVNSQQFHARQAYQEAANKILGGVKYTNKITFDEQDVISKLQKQFPEIASARVELPIFAQTPVLHLQISKPSFILTGGSGSYIVDSQGVAVARTSDFDGAHTLLTVEDQSGFEAKVGNQVMSADSVNFINTLFRQSKHSNVAIKTLTLPKTAQELDLRTNDRAYFVKFYLGGDALLQSGQFLATRHQLDASNTQPADYLDVRVPGKIFYK
jgi:cell division septal protein FtsQ